MANYVVVGNADASDFLGGDVQLEHILKSMNMAKTIAVELGNEYDPPYTWNGNLPDAFVKILAEKIGGALKKNIGFKPNEEFIEELREDLKTVIQHNRPLRRKK